MPDADHRHLELHLDRLRVELLHQVVVDEDVVNLGELAVVVVEPNLQTALERLLSGLFKSSCVVPIAQRSVLSRTCYTCQVSSDLCTPFYDCTERY